jgi:hypothetical protein
MIRHLSGLAAIVMVAAWAMPSAAQPPAKKGPAVRDHRALPVRITMDQLHCLKTTERGNKADELYMVVAGKAPAGNFKKRLPDAKANYVFKAGQKAGATGWKAKDGKERGRPVLFAGSLKPGEHVRVTLMVMEQDKGNRLVDKAKGVVSKAKKASGVLGGLGGVAKKITGTAGKVAGKVASKAGSVVKRITGAVDKVSGVLDKINGISGGLLGGQIKAITTVNKAIQKAREALKGDGDDYIGGVTIVVKNVNGKLQVKYVPAAETKDLGAAGANGRNFEMTGGSARYKSVLNVK